MNIVEVIQESKKLGNIYKRPNEKRLVKYIEGKSKIKLSMDDLLADDFEIFIINRNEHP